jgi:hypothetical protein
MRIIKKRNKHIDRVATWLCRNCDSTIESTRSEGEHVYDARDGNAVKTRCPNCQVDNLINDRKFTGPRVDDPPNFTFTRE